MSKHVDSFSAYAITDCSSMETVKQKPDSCRYVFTLLLNKQEFHSYSTLIIWVLNEQ